MGMLMLSIGALDGIHGILSRAEGIGKRSSKRIDGCSLRKMISTFLDRDKGEGRIVVLSAVVVERRPWVVMWLRWYMSLWLTIALEFVDVVVKGHVRIVMCHGQIIVVVVDKAGHSKGLRRVT